MKFVILSEKTSISSRLASILSDNTYSQSKAPGMMNYFDFVKDEIPHRIISLQGHMFKLDYPADLRLWSFASIKKIAETNPISLPRNKSEEKWLQKELESADKIVVATDFDREGELIAGEIIEHFNIPQKKIHRARFSSLSSQEINNSFINTVSVDTKMIEAGKCRQYIDLGWGASLTRFATLCGNGKLLSIGRVQTPTLYSIVKRQNKIDNFVSENYWNLHLTAKDGEKIKIFDYIKKISSQKEVDKIIEECTNNRDNIKLSTETSKYIARRVNPLNTVSALVLLSSYGITSERGMKALETLYQKAYISYPRTDNTVYPKNLNFISILKKNMSHHHYGHYIEALLEDNKYQISRGKKETTDHPPIYPLRTTPRTEDPFIQKVYSIILESFLCSISPSPIGNSIKQTINVGNHKFSKIFYDIISPGYFAVRSPSIDIETNPLEEKFDINSIKGIKKETKAPRMYSHGSIIKKMEIKGIGTKSTRHTIIKTLIDREYVNTSLNPTELGSLMIKVLEKEKADIIHSDMTHALEDNMDLVESGKKDWNDVISDSRTSLINSLDSMFIKKMDFEKQLKDFLNKKSIVCDCKLKDCEGSLVIRGKQGRKFMGCSEYPKCKNTVSLPNPNIVSIEKDICKRCQYPFGIFNLPKIGRKKICCNFHCPTYNEKFSLTDEPCENCTDNCYVVQFFDKSISLFCPSCRKRKYVSNWTKFYKSMGKIMEKGP